MPLDDLVTTIDTIKNRIAKHQGSLAANETRTRQVLVDPLLRALGWNVEDPDQVELEYDIRGKRADYALVVNSKPVAVIEAKRLGLPLVDDNTLQVMNYANTAGIDYMVVTNGNEWNMYSVFERGTIEDRVIMQLKMEQLSSHINALQSLSMWRTNLSSGSTTTSANEPVLLRPSIPTAIKLPETRVVHPDENWTPLDALQVNSSDNPPSSTLIASEEIPLSPKNWTEYFVQFAKWLVATNRLGPRNAPVFQSETSKWCLINLEPRSPTGAPFKAPAEIGAGLWIDKNRNTPNKHKALVHLLSHCGVDPATVKVRTP